VRRIPVQYAKQVIGNTVYGGQRHDLPLTLNAAGGMPIIFAQSLMFLPSLAASAFSDQSEIAGYISTTFANIESWEYSLSFALLIILFTFFYTAISVNPNQIAEDMKRNGGFVPGVKPGLQTSEYIDAILSRITLPGALFLAAIAILPGLASRLGVVREFAQFFGGTSLLIMVGVVLDTLQQIESHLLMRHYEGLMKSGRVKGRSENVAA
jgi:preprotein translocase subunit SecY